MKRHPGLKRFFQGRQVRIWSNEHGSWWGPNAAGYFITKPTAGIYQFEDAWLRSKHCDPSKGIVYQLVGVGTFRVQVQVADVMGTCITRAWLFNNELQAIQAAGAAEVLFGKTKEEIFPESTQFYSLTIAGDRGEHFDEALTAEEILNELEADYGRGKILHAAQEFFASEASQKEISEEPSIEINRI